MTGKVVEKSREEGVIGPDNGTEVAKLCKNDKNATIFSIAMIDMRI